MPSHNVLCIGSGGREHALVAAIVASEGVEVCYAAPGNPGMAFLDQVECVDLEPANHQDVIAFCKDHDITMVVIGPEQPLVDGLVDTLRQHEIPAFGPSAYAAQLEGSKAFAKEFMAEFGIPTATSELFTLSTDADAMAIKEWIEQKASLPIVLKADGLAAGKGVFVCETLEDVSAALEQCLASESLRQASTQLVVEEFMEGEEASVFVITDGYSSQILGVAQDHKRIYDGDKGPNTGGMGAYSPAPVVTDALLDQIQQMIVEPTITGLQVKDAPYTGILYVGLMLTEAGPKVVEYNCRFGDPECQCILPCIKNDFIKLCEATVLQELDSFEIHHSGESTCCVVLAADGYPASYPKGMLIRGLDKVETVHNDSNQPAIVFHAGTATDDHRQVVTKGGRVLTLVGRGATLQEAVKHAYQAVDMIEFEHKTYRKDIAQKGLNRLQNM
ncbi:MAG: phosphoribosylamine--glycine ligase [Balneolaceae bacterium]|nr:phosphoribosylamine--glycine ligase [Balneolaceae bacterium]